MPKGKHRWREISREIIRRLQQGITMGPATRHFIESTFSIATPEQIRAFLAETDGGDDLMLVQAVFYPDLPLQERLEPILADTTITPAKQGFIVQAMLSEIPQINIHLPDNSGSFQVFVDEFLINRFVRGLHLDYCIDPEIADALAQCLDPAGCCRARVNIRNAGIMMTADRKNWLSAVIRTVFPDSDEPMAILDFILWFLASLTHGADIFSALGRCKTGYVSAVRQARRQEEQLARGNMETLMATGSPIGYVNMEEALQHIDMIDRICLSVYGRAPFSDAPVIEQDMGEFGPDSDIGEVVKALLLKR